MRRFLIFAILLIYTTVTSGVNIQLHYCGGKIKSFSLVKHGADEKGCCGKKMKSRKCCNEKEAAIKLKVDHHHSVSSVAPGDILKLIPVLSLVDIINFENLTGDKLVVNYHAPPVIPRLPVYLRNGLLLI